MQDKLLGENTVLTKQKCTLHIRVVVSCPPPGAWFYKAFQIPSKFLLDQPSD